MEVRLDGRTAIITGSSKGLGLAMAKEFAASGANVAILARSPEVLDEARRSRRRARRAGRDVLCDVSKADDIEKTFAAVIKTFGKVDILINNAGISRAMPSDQITDEIWQEDLDLKLFAAIRLTRLVLAGDEGAQMGADHQRAEHRGEGAAGQWRADRGVARGRHGADEGAGRRGRAARHPGERHAGGADRFRSARAAASARRAPTCRTTNSARRWAPTCRWDASARRRSSRRWRASCAPIMPAFTTGTAINMDGGASPVV